jgi:ComF family protein
MVWYLNMVSHAVADLIYPAVCLLCFRRLDAPAALFCEGCARSLPRLSPPVCRHCATPLAGAHDLSALCRDCERRRLAFDRARAPLLFKGPVREAVHAFKYRGSRRIGAWLASEMARVAAQEGWIRDGSVIVPVPMHWLKARLRGMNAAACLAAGVARQTGLPCERRLLAKKRWTGTQTRRDPRQRFQNVEGAFRAGAAVGRSVLLVDDVLTTGATAHACAAALRQAGAASVFVLAAACAPAGETGTPP